MKVTLREAFLVVLIVAMGLGWLTSVHKLQNLLAESEEKRIEFEARFEIEHAFLMLARASETPYAATEPCDDPGSYPNPTH